MVRTQSALLAFAAAGSVFCAPAGAEVSFVERTLLARIDGVAPDFSDATLTFINTYRVGAGSSGSRVFTSIPFPTITSIRSSTTGDVSLSDEDYSMLPSGYSATVHATGPAGGTFTFESTYTTLLDPDGPGPLYRYLRTADASYAPVPFGNPNLTALELYLPIGVGVDPGNPFTVNVSVTGNYSTTAGPDSVSGQHWLVDLTPAWTVTRNFVHDPVANRTLFSAVNPAAQADQVVGLDVYLVGAVAAVPEPATWLPLAAGVAALAVIRRRRGVAGGRPADC